jgi:fibronectin type 3 domain-containing protein
VNTRSLPLLLAVSLLLGMSAGCGKRGNPLAPIRPAPGPVLTLTVRRVDDDVLVRFTLPSENIDHTTPAALARVEIYAAAGPVTLTAPVPMSIPPMPYTVPVNGVLVPVASTPFLLSRVPPIQLFVPLEFVKARRAKAPEVATTAVAIQTKKHLRGTVDVKPAPKEASADGAPAEPGAALENDPRPAPGDATTYTEQVAAERAAAAKNADVSVLRYVIVGVTPGKRPGTPSPVLEVPLTMDVSAPRDAAVTYDETTTTLTWTAGGPAQTFRVYRLNDAGKEDGPPLTPVPLAATTFSTPVEFDQRRCFSVRSVVVRGPVSVESEPAGPTCLTAVDTFPPPAPSGLSTLPTEGRVQLIWNAVNAPDLAGYLVLRSEDAAPAVPLMTDPITETGYTDTTPKPGARYVYTVVAVDKAGNRSAPSEPREEIIR